jgi:CDP-2,3-bis-(O-geranylgeranyl)-sn-glycerol synthase
MSALPLLQALWLAIPIVLAGALHLLVIALGWLSALARIPLDAGVMLRGRPLLGANKTLRGAVTMVTATIATVTLQAAAFRRSAWADALWLVDFERVSPLSWGALLGVGYVAGELPNSFVKRRFGIEPGAVPAGVGARLCWIADQLDSVVGILLCMALVTPVSAATAALLIVLGLGIHPLMALLMVRLGLKQRVG